MVGLKVLLPLAPPVALPPRALPPVALDGGLAAALPAPPVALVSFFSELLPLVESAVAPALEMEMDGSEPEPLPLLAVVPVWVCVWAWVGE